MTRNLKTGVKLIIAIFWIEGFFNINRLRPAWERLEKEKKLFLMS